MIVRLRRKWAGFLILTAGLLANVCAASDSLAAVETRVVSPDGAVQLKVFLHEGRLHYAITFKDRPVIEASPLVFTLDGVDLAEGPELGEVKSYEVKETYSWRGIHSRAVNRCNGASVRLRHAKGNTACTLELRAYDDGAAFRWIVPGGRESRVPDEATRFVLPAGSTVWSHDLEGHYEGVHQKKAIADVPAGEWAAPPLTFKLPDGGGYASIAEAALANYAGMVLQADGRRGFTLVLGHKHHVSYPFRLRYSKKDIERLSRPAAVAGTITSPWRVVPSEI
jgi:alpha-glucosidase